MSLQQLPHTLTKRRIVPATLTDHTLRLRPRQFNKIQKKHLLSDVLL